MSESTTLVIPADRFIAAVAALTLPPAQAKPHAARPQRRPHPSNATLAPRKGHTMADNAALLRVQQQQQQQPGLPRPSPALAPQPDHVDQPQHPLPGNPPAMPQPTPPETPAQPGL